MIEWLTYWLMYWFILIYWWVVITFLMLGENVCKALFNSSWMKLVIDQNNWFMDYLPSILICLTLIETHWLSIQTQFFILWYLWASVLQGDRLLLIGQFLKKFTSKHQRKDNLTYNSKEKRVGTKLFDGVIMFDMFPMTWGMASTNTISNELCGTKDRIPVFANLEVATKACPEPCRWCSNSILVWGIQSVHLILTKQVTALDIIQNSITNGLLYEMWESFCNDFTL